MNALYKNNKLQDIQKVLDNTTAVVAKAPFNYLQALRTRINGHDKDLDYWIKISTTSWQ